MESRIFNMEVSFIEWPGISDNLEKSFSPFNRSMYKLRTEYPNVFPEIYAKD